jgi:multicomponent K+:H+ antiporter subunit E
MMRWLPYPGLAVSLLAMWLMLNKFTPGHLVLGTAVALLASWSVASLDPPRARIRNWRAIPRFAAIVFLDIARSNIAVAGLILGPGSDRRVSGFVTIRLVLRNRLALAILACIVTSTPGTAWVEYDRRRNTLLLHVFDLVDESDWIDLIKNRYEQQLLEIFE